jgi:hypothetical protein
MSNWFDTSYLFNQKFVIKFLYNKNKSLLIEAKIDEFKIKYAETFRLLIKELLEDAKTFGAVIFRVQYKK